MGRVVRTNPVAEQFTGWSETEGLGRPLSQVFRIMSEETRAEVPSSVSRVLHEGMPAGRNHRHLVAAAWPKYKDITLALMDTAPLRR